MLAWNSDWVIANLQSLKLLKELTIASKSGRPSFAQHPSFHPWSSNFQLSIEIHIVYTNPGTLPVLQTVSHSCCLTDVSISCCIKALHLSFAFSQYQLHLLLHIQTEFSHSKNTARILSVCQFEYQIQRQACYSLWERLLYVWTLKARQCQC